MAAVPQGVVDLTASDDDTPGGRLGSDEELKVVDYRPAPSSASRPRHHQPAAIDLDDDEVQFDDSAVCIGMLMSLALIMYPIKDLTLPSTVGPRPQRPPPLPCRVLRAQPQNGNETLKLVNIATNEQFAVVEHRVANVVGPLLGSAASPGPVTLEANVLRKPEQNVRAAE